MLNTAADHCLLRTSLYSRVILYKYIYIFTKEGTFIFLFKFISFAHVSTTSVVIQVFYTR